MIGLTALVGAGEYLPTMDVVDRRLLAETNSRPARVACIPAAAGQEGEASVERWSQMGVAHFRRLGVAAASARIGGEWEVMGAGGVSLMTRDEVVVYRTGSRTTLPDG